jgi:hypothetical protein
VFYTRILVVYMQLSGFLFMNSAMGRYFVRECRNEIFILNECCYAVYSLLMNATTSHFVTRDCGHCELLYLCLPPRCTLLFMIKTVANYP